MLDRKKIALIGSGNIGASLAYLISSKGLWDVVMLDIDEDMSKGKALDVGQSAGILGNDINFLGTNEYKDIVDSEVLIITAGLSRKPGMTRNDLVMVNSEIMYDIASNIKKSFSKTPFIIVVTNPLDIMVWIVQKVTQFSTNKIVGMSGVLDTARFNYFLAKELNISVNNINSFVLGGHGDNMLPLIRYSSVAGISIPDLIKLGYISMECIENIIKKTRNGGGEIVNLLKTSSAYYAPAASALFMAESYLLNKKKIVSCSAYLSGEYGFNGIYVGVPVMLGANGVEKIIEVELDIKEKLIFKKSVDEITTLIDKVRQKIKL